MKTTVRIISVCVALAYIPLARMSSAKGISVFAISVIYWICMCFIPLAFVRLCYEANWAGILFRTLLAVTANNFITTIAYYLFTKVLFPKFPAEHPVFYMLFLTVFTIFTLICARFRELPGRHVKTTKGDGELPGRHVKTIKGDGELPGRHVKTIKGDGELPGWHVKTTKGIHKLPARACMGIESGLL